jgi:hypothetical protein
MLESGRHSSCGLGTKTVVCMIQYLITKSMNQQITLMSCKYCQARRLALTIVVSLLYAICGLYIIHIFHDNRSLLQQSLELGSYRVTDLCSLG